MYNKYKILHIILLCFIFCGCCRIIPDKLSDSSRYDIIGEVINERMVLLSDSLRYERNEYVVFDTIVDLLVRNGGRARKGNGRNYKLGEPECDETTVVGAIAKYYAGKKYGDSVFDPVFVFAAVLEWAGIAHNERGELVLTQAYRSLL